MPPSYATTARRALRYLSTGLQPGKYLNEAIQSLAEDVDAQLLVRSLGNSIIATSESRTNAAYGLLTTPDRVQNVVLPTGGLIAVVYQATWQESVNQAARAAIFIGANQLKIASGGGTVDTTAAITTSPGTGVDRPLTSAPVGLVSGGALGTEVTTGQAVGIAGGSLGYELSGGLGVVNPAVGFGGECLIFAAAGTYDISVQFKSSSGSVTAKDRKLWVWSLF